LVHLQVLYKHKIILFGGFYDTLREVRLLTLLSSFLFVSNFSSASNEKLAREAEIELLINLSYMISLDVFFSSECQLGNIVSMFWF
jgi:hypothetical protein